MEIENSSNNNLVNTLTKSIPESFTSNIVDSAVDEVESTASSFFTNIILMIILFAVIGGFIYIYLAKGEKSFTEYVTSYLNDIRINTAKDEDDEIDYGNTGSTGSYQISARDTTTDTTTPITTKSETKTERQTETKDDSAVECDNPKKEKLMKALNNAAQTVEYMADDASSSIQSINKSKWCFIGEEKSVRNCVLLNDSQKCMSGDIFPSKDICINPNMRS